MSITTNGAPRRKQLSDQLDRLDGIIDALADGLNEAVADAAREGVHSAVTELLQRVLTDPTVLTSVLKILTTDSATSPTHSQSRVAAVGRSVPARATPVGNDRAEWNRPGGRS